VSVAIVSTHSMELRTAPVTLSRAPWEQENG
jgi:hypothetical protein